MTDVYFEDASFAAAQWAFRNTDGTEADCLRAAVEAAAPFLAAAERERIRQLAKHVAATYPDANPDSTIGYFPFAELLAEAG